MGRRAVLGSYTLCKEARDYVMVVLYVIACTQSICRRCYQLEVASVEEDTTVAASGGKLTSSTRLSSMDSDGNGIYTEGQRHCASDGCV